MGLFSAIYIARSNAHQLAKLRADKTEKPGLDTVIAFIAVFTGLAVFVFIAWILGIAFGPDPSPILTIIAAFFGVFTAALIWKAGKDQV